MGLLKWLRKTQQNSDGGKSKSAIQYPILGPETIMKRRKHGTSRTGVQEDLRWNVSNRVADRICNYNRQFAEPAGSFQRNNSFMENAREIVFQDSENGKETPIVFYDSNTGYPLFQAPVGRSWKDFIQESRLHGWPSFRDEEVIWDRVRCLEDGECVSLDGTHLGHNIPDGKGNRYCINLCSVAGNPILHEANTSTETNTTTETVNSSDVPEENSEQS